MPSSTVENYLKRLLSEQQRLELEGEAGDRLVPMGQLAAVMNVAPGTATAMVKALDESGLVEYEPRGGVRLTPRGQKLALHVVRRHRLVELFLVEVLKLDWSEVHPEAEELEHAISDKVLERIDALLGHPRVDPHGDPIPTAGGEVALPAMQTLATCELDEPLRIARVTDQDPQFLQFLERSGLKPGVGLVVQSRSPFADAVTIKPSGCEPISVGTSAAAKILVQAEGEPIG